MPYEQVQHVWVQGMHLRPAAQATATTAPEASMIIVLTVLAVARVTRFITTDHIFGRPRNALVRWLSDRGHDQLAYLVFCPWCMSVYVGAAAAGAWYVWGETMPFMAVTLALAASYVTGFLASIKEAGD